MKRMAPFVTALLASVFAVGTVVAERPLGKTWPKEQRTSLDRIRHDRFDVLLKRYVDTDGYVDYSAWKANTKDRDSLRKYLRLLSRANLRVRATKQARLAFWINAYNAVTLEGILLEYPTTSIRNHTATVVGYNIWNDLPIIIDDRQFSLSQIEHDVLRKLDEPRIHFAIVCASIGCPRLRNEAWTADKMVEQLADNTREFFARPQNMRTGRDGQTLHVSELLDWFADDFGADQTKRMAYLSQWMPRKARLIAGKPNTRIAYLDYNWSLNDQKSKGQR